MGPYEVDYLRFFLALLGDWRVLAVTFAVFLLWALLRFVGLGSNRPARRKKKRMSAAAKKAAKPAKQPKAAAESRETDEELVE